MTTFTCDFPEMSDALMEHLFPQQDADELDTYLSGVSMCTPSLLGGSTFGGPTESMCTASLGGSTESTYVPTESMCAASLGGSTESTYVPTESMYAPSLLGGSTESTYVSTVPEVESVVTMQSVMDDPLMLLLHFQTLTSGAMGETGGDAAGRTATSRVNFERVAFLARKMVKELNKADDTTSVAQFCNVLSHTMSSGVTPNVTSLMHQLEEEQLLLKLQNQRLRLQLQELEQEEVRRRASTPKRKHAEREEGVMKDDVMKDDVTTTDSTKKQRTLSFTTAQGEVYERLRGNKERKVDLIVRTCLFKFGGGLVTKKQIEQVAMDVGYFSGNAKELRQQALIKSKAGRELNTKSYIKPWGHFFPYWEESANESGEIMLRLSPEFLLASVKSHN